MSGSLPGVGKSKRAGATSWQDHGKIRVLIADDQFLLRAGLVTSINAEADMTVIAEANAADEAIARYRTYEPDILVMDLKPSGGNGLTATVQIVREFPDARIILSTYDGDDDIHRALRAGARSYLLKTAQREELLAVTKTLA